MSACSTGPGKDVRGEGIIGLTRGFMYAGAASVMVSLWKVDDEATAELMCHFYRNLLRNDLPPAAALREAQLAMWKQRRWRAPYFWAAFVLQGEYRSRLGALEHPSNISSSGNLLAAGMMVFSLRAAFFSSAADDEARKNFRRALATLKRSVNKKAAGTDPDGLCS